MERNYLGGGGWENIGQGGTGKEGSDRYEKKIPLEPWSEQTRD